MCNNGIKRQRPEPRLTARECAILRAWLTDDSKSGAADRLFVTASTVATTVERIRRKYAAVGRPAGTKAALFARALQDGLMDLDEL